MSLSFAEFIKSESGVCLLLAIGCVIFALLLVFLIIRDKRNKESSYTELNLKQEIKTSHENVKEEIKEEKVVEKKEEKVKAVSKKATTKKPTEKKKESTSVEKVEEVPVEPKAKEEKAVEVKKEEKSQRVTNYHVSKHPNGGWQVKREGASRAIKIFDTQAEAIAFAKEKSENQDNNVVIHKKSGQIRKQDYSKK